MEGKPPINTQGYLDLAEGDGGNSEEGGEDPEGNMDRESKEESGKVQRPKGGR